MKYILTAFFLLWRVVNSIDEMNAATCVPTDPVFIQFDDDNGKIYGYKDLKINIYFNVNSFHSYVDIAFQSKKDVSSIEFSH